MFSLSYTITDELKNALIEIDSLRGQLLTIPLPPKTEIRLRWETTLDHIWGSTALSGLPFSKQTITKALTSAETNQYGEIWRYKRCIDLIRTTWPGSPKPITLTTIETLGNLLYPTRGQSFSFRRALGAVAPTLTHLCTYIEKQHEHPVVTAAVFHAGLLIYPAFGADNGRLARLVSAAHLTKYGYDIRSLVALEPVWVNHRDEYVQALTNAQDSGNLTTWLPFMVAMTKRAFTERLEDIRSGHVYLETPAHFWDLTDRQKQILLAFEEPGLRVTNTYIQKKYRVSQITASRDLTTLAKQGHIYTHKKGRSTYYTKI